MRKFLVAFLLAGCLVLAGASPALAKQPYPLNYHTFDLSGGTPDGLTYSGGALTISATPAGTFPYQDPYAQPQPYADPYAQPQPISAKPYPTSPAYPAAPQYPVAGYGAPVAPPTQTNSNALGLISMILGIISIPVACCGVLSFVLIIPSIVLGILGIKKVNEGQATNKGMAMAGLICGGVAAVIAVGLIILGTAVRLNNLTNN